MKANPSFFALVFSQGPPLILETFRRIELVMFILSQRERKEPQPKISNGRNIRFHKPDGTTETIEFERMINTTLLNVYKDKLRDP